MKQVIITFSILFIVLMSGCGTPYQIIKTVDTGNPNLLIYKSSQIKIKGNSTSDTYDTFLRYFGYVNKDKRSYAFDILYCGKEWGIFSKVKLNIDGIKSKYSVKGIPIRSEKGVHGLTEELVVEIPNNKIEELIDNRKCKMEIIGQNLTIKVDFKQEWFDKLILFYVAMNKK